MLSKVWYLAYVEKPPADIIQNMRKNIHNFLWNYRNVRVNRSNISLSVKMAGLAIMDMLWHLDQYRKAKERVNIFKAYTGNTNRAPILPTYRTCLSS